MPTLEECRELATYQARVKDWNVSTKWLIKKLNEEFNNMPMSKHLAFILKLFY